LKGDEKLGAFVDVSIDAAEDDWYSKEFLDCNITTGDLTVENLINGEVTNDGKKLEAEIITASSFRFVRFSTRIDIITSFDVQVSI
jgi:ribosomal protein S7